MAAKDDPVVDLVEEEEEEEWPEVGVQNIEEAECYTDKINNVLITFQFSFIKILKLHYLKPFKILRRLLQTMGKHGGC